MRHVHEAQGGLGHFPVKYVLHDVVHHQDQLYIVDVLMDITATSDSVMHCVSHTVGLGIPFTM